MKKLVFLSIGMFTVGCNSFIIAGLLPEIGQTIEQSIAVTGQGITAFSLAYLVSALLFSMIFSNKSVKHIIQFALATLLLGNLVTIVSESLVLFLIGRAIAGIGAGIFTPLCVSIAVQLADSSRKGRVLSLIWGANSAGMVFGIPFGLYLSTLFNWQFTITYIVVLSLIALIGISFQSVEIKLLESSSFFARLRLLTDQKIMFVIGITCFTSMACIGLHSYIAPIQAGTPNSLTIILFAWGLGGFIGSSLVGTFVDRTKKPQVIMVLILVGLIITFMALPFIKNLNYIGVIPFFLWGVLGWATITPQQHILFELKEEQGTILSALNSSAIGLGGALGTAVGGSLIASGTTVANLPFLAAALLLCVLIFQLLLNRNLKMEYYA